MDGKDNFCFVHIDSNTFNETNLAEFKKLIKTRNCRLIRNPKSISWGGFSIIEATMALINEALTFTKVQFDYLSLHSGEDLPLKTNHYIANYLASNYGRQFVEHFEISNKTHWKGNGGLDRLEYYWFLEQVGWDKSKELVKVQKLTSTKKSLPNKIGKLYGGSQWWTITANCAKYVMETLAGDLTTFNYFKFSFIPDETLFQTIILNSPYFADVDNNNLRLIDWKSGPSYPKILTFGDELRLKESKSLFARKFDMTYNLKIIQAISIELASGKCF